MTIIKQTIPTTNYMKGRQGKKITTIVIHWFGIGTLKSADARFKGIGNQSSAHYGVSGETVYNWVSESDTAYHSGVWTVNQTSIGIEHDATTQHKASADTYDSSAQLIAQIWKRHGKLPLKKHSDFKATQCPGTLDLNKLTKLAEGYFKPMKKVFYKQKNSKDVWYKYDGWTEFTADGGTEEKIKQVDFLPGTNMAVIISWIDELLKKIKGIK